MQVRKLYPPSVLKTRRIIPGSEVVVEELLTGPEVSVLALSDGYSIVPLPAAQDHKRIGDGDTGLNTGGMGAYAPAPVATPEILARIMRETLRPTIDGMRKEGAPQHFSLRWDILLIFCRVPILGHTFHWLHAHPIRSKGPGIQCALRRSRDRSAHGSTRRRR